MATSKPPAKRRSIKASRALKAATAVSARLDAATDRQFRAAAQRAGVGVSDLLRDAVKAFVNAKSEPSPQPVKPVPVPAEQPLDQVWGAAFKTRLDALEATTKAELLTQRKALSVALTVLKKMAEEGLQLDVSEYFPQPKAKPQLTATQLEYLANMREAKAQNKAHNAANKKAE